MKLKINHFSSPLNEIHNSPEKEQANLFLAHSPWQLKHLSLQRLSWDSETLCKPENKLDGFCTAINYPHKHPPAWYGGIWIRHIPNEKREEVWLDDVALQHRSRRWCGAARRYSSCQIISVINAREPLHSAPSLLQVSTATNPKGRTPPEHKRCSSDLLPSLLGAKDTRVLLQFNLSLVGKRNV